MKPHTREIYQRLLSLGAQAPWRALEALCDALEEGKMGKYKEEPLRWRSQGSANHYAAAALHYHFMVEEKDLTTHVSHYIARSMMAGEKLLETIDDGDKDV